MNYRERTKKYVEDETNYGIGFIVYAYKEHVKKHGDFDCEEDVDFFSDEGRFQKFLNAEADEEVIEATLVRYGGMVEKIEHANKMIEEGEKLIRKAHRILDDVSYVAHPMDYVADRPRTHNVSLVGIHDDDFIVEG